MGAVKPVVKGVYVCDDVLLDPTSRKVSLLNVFITARPPASFPFELQKLCAFVALRGGRGRTRLRVEIVHTGTDVVVFRSSDRELTFLDPLVTAYALFRLGPIRFTRSGRYSVEVFCDDVFLDDELITVLAAPEGGR